MVSHTLPPVSCLCLTYGRPHVLEEAIESFLIQDYAGPKELLVLNDLSEQRLHCDLEGVRIINVPARFHSVGEKRNASAALATHDILFVWDDDDIYLPHRISYSVAQLQAGAREFYKPSRAWILNGEQLLGPESNLFHSGACFTRTLFDSVRGYRHMGSGQDHEFEMDVARVLPYAKNDDRITAEEIYYVYRWNGTSSYHLSDFGRDRPGVPPGQERVGAYVQAALLSGNVPTGDVELRPAWRRDYAGLIHGAVSLVSSGAAQDEPHTATSELSDP